MTNAFETFIDKAAADFKTVLSFFGSKQGQTVVAVGEAAATTIAGAVGGPGLAGVVSGVEGLVNSGVQNVLTTEATATALGAQAATSTQKAAVVTASLSSDAGAFLKSIGVNDATDEEVETLATAIGSTASTILAAIPARAYTAAPAPAPAS